MFERILVALDGSAASEAALVEARALAKAFSATLILAHIVEARPPRRVHGQPHLAEPIQAEAYLEEKAQALRDQGLRVETHVHHEEGQPGSSQREVAEALADHAAELGFDLAVMAAHGRRTASDYLWASLPLKVAAAGCASVYLARRAPGAKAWTPPASILLPLDGRPEHEAALAQAVALAKALRLPLALLAVVPRRPTDSLGKERALARFSPGMNRASLEYAAERSRDYLAGLAARLKAEGVELSWSVERGRPARRILRAAAAAGALVVLSTHRRLGFDAALEGCVAFSVATRYSGESLIAPVPRCKD